MKFANLYRQVGWCLPMARGARLRLLLLPESRRRDATLDRGLWRCGRLTSYPKSFWSWNRVSKGGGSSSGCADCRV